MLGGSHGMNVMIYFRGNEADFDHWQKLGNPSWGWDENMEFFKKSFKNLNSKFVAHENGKFHGVLGPVPLDILEHYDNFSVEFLEAAKELGYNYFEDLNSGAKLGYTFAQVTATNGTRFTTAKSFLRDAGKRPNLHIIKHATVLMVEIDENNVATGVRFQYRNKELVARARKEVILSAGTIGSAQILLLSGIGPKGHLQTANIPLKQNLPVGENLKDHIMVPLFFEMHRSNVPEKANEADLKKVLDETNISEWLRYLLKKTGPYTNLGLFDLIGLINSENRTGIPDIATEHELYERQSIGLKAHLDALEFHESISQPLLELNKNTEIFFVVVELLRPKSKGKLELRSANHNDKPKLFHNYLDDDYDMETLIRGTKFQHSFVNTSVFKKHKMSLVKLALPKCDDFEYFSDAYWDCYIRHMTMTIYHYIGTVKMGPNTDKTSVVDWRLKVKGLNGLRVIDASIMPEMISANTNAATIMIGEKGSHMIREDWTEKNRNEL